MRSQNEKTEFLALTALFAGALSAGISGVFVRLSETGPTATAFWRGLLALPLLALWAALERRPRELKLPEPTVPRPQSLRSLRDWRFLAGGFFFAGDLAVWHWSLLLTSVALSTLEASLAPLVVTLIAWLAWGERPRLGFLAALGLALGGLLLMMSPKLGHGSSAFLGDALGCATACFYAAYIVVVARLRERYGTGTVMFNTTLVFTVLLLPLALTQKFLPDTLWGWAMLAGCAVGAQFLGQGLIAYALAHLPATFGSVGLYLQSIGAAVCAWLVLGEHLSAVQIVGGGIVLGAIALARSTRSRQERRPVLESKPPPKPAPAHSRRVSLPSSPDPQSESH